MSECVCVCTYLRGEVHPFPCRGEECARGQSRPTKNKGTDWLQVEFSALLWRVDDDLPGPKFLLHGARFCLKMWVRAGRYLGIPQSNTLHRGGIGQDPQWTQWLRYLWTSDVLRRPMCQSQEASFRIFITTFYLKNKSLDFFFSPSVFLPLVLFPPSFPSSFLSFLSPSLLPSFIPSLFIPSPPPFWD